MDRGVWWAIVLKLYRLKLSLQPWGCKELHMTERLSILHMTTSPLTEMRTVITMSISSLFSMNMVISVCMFTSIYLPI